MSTRIEVSQLNNDGSVQAIFLKDYTRGWQYDLLYEIKEKWTEPEAVKEMFSRQDQDDSVLSFGSCAEFKDHFLNGDGVLVEYIFLYSQRKGTWTFISLNSTDWKQLDWQPDTLERLGMPLSQFPENRSLAQP